MVHSRLGWLFADHSLASQARSELLLAAGRREYWEEAILTALEVLRVRYSDSDQLSPYRSLRYPNLQKLYLTNNTLPRPRNEHWWQLILHNAPYSRLEQVTLTVNRAYPLYLSDLVTQHPSIHLLTLNGRSVHEIITDPDIVDICEALRSSREGGRPLGLCQLTISDRINLTSSLISSLAELGVGSSYCHPEWT